MLFNVCSSIRFTFTRSYSFLFMRIRAYSFLFVRIRVWANTHEDTDRRWPPALAAPLPAKTAVKRPRHAAWSNQVPVPPIRIHSSGAIRRNPPVGSRPPEPPSGAAVRNRRTFAGREPPDHTDP
ncbi:hypothetical protein SGFS_056350 [Streptomyces graminofaciens]|uniref:Secreted protein n=1 Tax=Streptomyces graminofaciens TaxID=68212 RepID=A0ABM8HLF8_9ACTN|nr:hypothetical protein SGFS_056350 [Streptomyces graminofaciens]